MATPGRCSRHDPRDRGRVWRHGEGARSDHQPRRAAASGLPDPGSDEPRKRHRAALVARIRVKLARIEGNRAGPRAGQAQGGIQPRWVTAHDPGPGLHSGAWASRASSSTGWRWSPRRSSCRASSSSGATNRSARPSCWWCWRRVRRHQRLHAARAARGEPAHQPAVDGAVRSSSTRACCSCWPGRGRGSRCSTSATSPRPSITRRSPRPWPGRWSSASCPPSCRC